MAVKISFEIGHTAKLKSKKTPEGFTHDWELHVRGVDKSDISHFVDKVVFNLHDSFPKPKRTCKEAPYILKESGYAGFVFPIDIYFKNRDDPKRVTYQYDLDLQNTGPPVHRSVVKKFVFNNPSDEFKQKLLKGGGSLLMVSYDEKSRDSIDERTQTSNKTKSTNDAIKKNKIRPEDSKMQTFATVFGPPITKTTTKVSPDPKSKGSPSLTVNNKGNNKAIEKSSSVSTSGFGKDKIEKNDKKDKHRRSSPHRDRDSSKDVRKISNEEKHERKEEKNKEKSHSKDRDHSKDRALKRPASPKRLPSPKRPSPSRSSIAGNRGEDNVSKQIKSEQENKKISSTSSKKSKKDKKSHEKDKDRERKERDRERKEKDDRSSSSNPSTTSTNSNLSHPGGNQIKNNVETKIENTKKAESAQLKEIKEVKKIEGKIKENVNSEKKILEKPDKDFEKKHKHKKKEKSKEKDREKDLPSKEKKKEKNNKQTDIKKISQPSPQLGGDSNLSGQQKSTSTSASNNNVNKLSDQDSSDSESENLAPPASESKSNNNHSESSNSSFPDLMVQSKPTVSHFEGTKIEKKEHKSREKLKVEKNGKKRKRKSKDDQEQQQIRKSASPIINTQIEAPPNKQFKKEDFKIDNNKTNSPALITTAQMMPQEVSPRIGNNNSPVFRTPSSASVPVALSATNNINDRNTTINVDYMSELRELQHKIMTLQDNNELQQVVEMIAATGRFEVTSKTFDFDLCALDRTTVQRLQDFLATSVS